MSTFEKIKRLRSMLSGPMVHFTVFVSPGASSTESNVEIGAKVELNSAFTAGESLRSVVLEIFTETTPVSYLFKNIGQLTFWRGVLARREKP